MKKETDHNFILQIIKLQRLMLVAILLFSLFFIAVAWIYYHPQTLQKNVDAQRIDSKQEKKWITIDDYSPRPFDKTAEGELAAMGEKLIKETDLFFGPNSRRKSNKSWLTCSSCHLNAGTKSFAAPYIGLSGVYPVYMGRENHIASLEERINGCFERSLNGTAIDVESREMKSIVTYINHLSHGLSVGVRVQGQGFVELKPPNRKADIKQGEILFQSTCVSCHGSDGEGKKESSGKKYIYPPLWGEDSYNDGAGMARLLTAARFIKGNMPLGTTYKNPILTDDQAYDIAAFVNSHNRPIKKNKEKDYPDLSKKPVDCPYPPYQDNISYEQHKYGPYNFVKKKT